MKFTGILLISVLIFLSCKKNQPVNADLIVYNAKVYTVDSAFTIAEAFAVKDGKFLAVGKTVDILEKYNAAEKIDAGGKAIYPGFIDAHCHFYSYGLMQNNVDLVGTKSFTEVIERVKNWAKNHPEGWIIGRGWDQNDWEQKSYPTKHILDELFPGRPVYLSRVDGHAALVNQDALSQANITGHTKIAGGEILLDKNKKPTGVLIDNAAEKVKDVIAKPITNTKISALIKAQQHCFGVGLTTVADAGLDKEIVDIIDSLQKAGRLKMRVYAMLNPTQQNFEAFLDKGIYVTDKLSVRSFKIYADGALGSRGACLKYPYTDMPHTHGFLLHDVGYFREMAQKIAATNFQMNTHCIGDSANRYLLQVYAEALKGKNNRRWRIEHAQVVDTADMHFFRNYNIIPSVQPTHATSDMYWAKERLGEKRMSGAYAYKHLLQNAGLLAGGSDFPVEGINPLFGFYAAVARKDAKGYPQNGFQPEDALSREEALKSMTIWAAYSNFEENKKGSIEPGKMADFVVLDEDIMKTDLTRIMYVKVLETRVGGEKVYKKP